MPMSLDGKQLWRCPLRPVYENPVFYEEAIAAFSWYKRGFLVDTGTWLDQPSKLLVCIDIIERTVSEIHNHEQRVAEQQSRRATKTTPVRKT